MYSVITRLGLVNEHNVNTQRTTTVHWSTGGPGETMKMKGKQVKGSKDVIRLGGRILGVPPNLCWVFGKRKQCQFNEEMLVHLRNNTVGSSPTYLSYLTMSAVTVTEFHKERRHNKDHFPTETKTLVY